MAIKWSHTKMTYTILICFIITLHFPFSFNHIIWERAFLSMQHQFFWFFFQNAPGEARTTNLGIGLIVRCDCVESCALSATAAITALDNSVLKIGKKLGLLCIYLGQMPTLLIKNSYQSILSKKVRCCCSDVFNSCVF